MAKVEICNHTIYRGAEIIAAKHLSQNEINEPQHSSDCNFIRSDGRPFCGNCMYEACDPETGISYCMISKRGA